MINKLISARVGPDLGDLGADVIKIESPGRGDYLRHMLGSVASGHSVAHLQVNRGKRSIAARLGPSATGLVTGSQDD